MKFKSKDIILTMMFASMYTVGCIALGISQFGIIQCRVVDALIPLSVLFGYPTIFGVTIGCVVANSYIALSTVDVIFGSVANLLASTLAYRLRRQPFFACTATTLTVTLIVGSYLWTLFNVPWEISIFGVFIGSLISINLVGYLLIKALNRSGVIKRYRLIVEG